MFYCQDEKNAKIVQHLLTKEHTYIYLGAVVAVIVWWLDLQLHVQ